MNTPQRLLVCLDGTWNNRDDSTNVAHHYDLVLDGLVPAPAGGPILQRKYYAAGVGTGPLDRLSGGGFGFGLEENVRTAYEWLAEHYHDGDEIYVFGFSRGAYTARSLVGFIGRCGLLRRGATLSVNQLWHAYCVIGRQREQRSTFLERAFGGEHTDMREITALVSDPWDHPPSAPRVAPETETEELLLHWSRRVKITFLGVYDTVGAMGWDALAIPGLTSQLALHHNMRPTSLIQHCRHALALDEHRSSFHHTPFVAYSGHGGTPGPVAEQEQHWAAEKINWENRIEQRWFVGAHANIGGGYESNRLGERPFAWMFAGAVQAGLGCETPLPPAPTARPLPRPRDSFAEFARPLWATILRAKRSYRRLAPPDAAKASVPTRLIGNAPAAGFSLCPINEQVDPTVWQFYATNPPPHLAEYVARVAPPGAPAYATPAHRWIGDQPTAHAAVAFLALFTATGVQAALQLFFPGTHVTTLPPLWLALIPALYVGVDWAESRVSFALAANGSRPTTRAFRDSIYWTRALAVVCSLLGVAYLLGLAWHAGIAASSRLELRHAAGIFLRPLWPAAAGAAGAVFIALALDRADRARWRAAPAALAGGAAALLAGPLVAALAFYLARLFAPLWPVHAFDALAGSSRGAAFAGALLLLQISFLYFVRAFFWCGEPLADVNLDSIGKLQLRATPVGVRAQLDAWRDRLACPWRDRDPSHNASTQMRAAVAEALARDAIGFIPVYFSVLLYGLWFASDATYGLGWHWLHTNIAGCELWLALPLVALLTDYFEDACHALYLWLHRKNTLDAAWLWLVTPLSWLASLTKLACFAVAAGTTFCAVAAATLRLPRVDAGWRAVPTLGISVTGAIVLAALAIGLLAARSRLLRPAAERVPR